MYLSTHMKELS